MTRILITGLNSYVGNNLEALLVQYPNKFIVDKVSLRNNSWRNLDLSTYDTIVHVAGIAHKKESNKNAELYYQVNRDLTIDIATKSKEEGVKQFIFLSSMSVYGLDTGVITDSTPLQPKTYYGKSKKQAEDKIVELQSTSFNVVILRPPMIYGKNCPGNYAKLRKLALRTPLFPDIDNKRSMIFIDNLSIYIRHLIVNNVHGVYCPQNLEYVKTSELVKLIATINNKKVYLTKMCNFLINRLPFSIIQKVFGTLIYENKYQCENIQQISFYRSILKAEGMRRDE